MVPYTQNQALSVPYCQKPPRNVELQGLYPCQFSSTNAQLFEGKLKPGDPSTVPFGLSGPVNPPGSCPAHPDGPIPDGVLLTTLTQTPNAQAGGDIVAAGALTGPGAASVSAPGEDANPDDEPPTQAEASETSISQISAPIASSGRSPRGILNIPSIGPPKILG